MKWGMEDKLHWIDLGDGEYKCPKCSREFMNGLDIQTFSKYFPSCPNCGTKMSEFPTGSEREEA
jgi:DNA-directed RNA polymerase subunit RPC12/RpoP